MIARIGQALETIGPVGILGCLIVASILALVIVLARN